jgi:mRNA interferase RelE/StbE
VVKTYKINFSQEAEASLVHLDKPVAQRILDRTKWLSQHNEDINHKALAGNLRGIFKLRVGDYRVLYEIKHNAAIIIIRFIGHRSDIYQ